MPMEVEPPSVSGSALKRVPGGCLHSSGTSEVFLAELEERTVAVKRTKITCANDISRFNKEIELLWLCAGHAGIVQPLGVVRAPPTYALVLPHFARGSLFKLLHDSAGRRLTASAALGIISDVADALAHLQARGLLHRDVKSDNVLISDECRALITDFNASELASRQTDRIMIQARPTGGFFKQFVVGTLPYMAPELLLGASGGGYTAACDVYSFAILANEVLTQTVPYSDALSEKIQLHTILEARYNHDALTAGISSGFRPAQPPEGGAATRALLELVRQCWAHQPSERPTVGQACETLLALCSALGASSGTSVDPRTSADTARELFEPQVLQVDEAERCAALKTQTVTTPIAPTKPALSRPGSAAALAALVGTEGLPCRRAGFELSAGKRGADRMEDRHVLIGSGGVTLAAVFDGHNGDGAAHFCHAELNEALCAAWPAGAGAAGAPDALRGAFLSLNRRFLEGFPKDVSGCTALAALCLPDKVIVANAGDCICKLWRGDELIALNREHSALLDDERERVKAAGATLSTTADGKLRVGGIIQVTRCIGDRPLRHLGLSSEPEIVEHSIGPTDCALVLASDGLWDVMPDARVVHCLKNTAKSPDMLAKRLLFDAMDRGTTDNVTVVVVLLRDDL